MTQLLIHKKYKQGEMPDVIGFIPGQRHDYPDGSVEVWYTPGQQKEIELLENALKEEDEYETESTTQRA